MTIGTGRSSVVGNDRRSSLFPSLHFYRVFMFSRRFMILSIVACAEHHSINTDAEVLVRGSSLTIDLIAALRWVVSNCRTYAPPIPCIGLFLSVTRAVAAGRMDGA